MTQKLTLPIEVGKKYVRRDGTVVTVTIGSDPVIVGVGGGNSVWVENGKVWRDNRDTEPTDLIADYIEPAAAHPHAEVMMEYAKDAATMAEPWENWEFHHPVLGWRNLGGNPDWDIDHEYRRKKSKVTINGIECVAGVKEPVFDGLYYVASLTRSEYYLTLRYTGAHKSYAERGLVHRTKEDAIAMSKAMLNFQ